MKQTRFIFVAFLLLLASMGWQNTLAHGAEPIRIGATVSMEGSYVEPSMMIRNSFKLWEQEVNQRGGLLGRRVELILYDDKSQKDLTRKLYRRLIEEDQVDFVFSPYGTPLTLVASEISEQHRLAMLACAASGEAIWERGHKYVFGVYALAKRYFIGQLDLMARGGHKEVSLVYNESSPFNVDVAMGAKKWAEKFRISINQVLSYQDGKKDLLGVVNQLKISKAEGLIVSAYPPDCYRLLDLMKKENYRPRILGMTIAPIHPDFLKKAGEIGEGVFGPSQWEANERIPFPGTKRFIKSFERFSGKRPSYHAGSAYAACQLYEKAINKNQSLDNGRIKDYFSALDTVTVIGRFKVDPKGKQIGHSPILIQWQKGKKEIVWPSKMQTAKPIL